MPSMRRTALQRKRKSRHFPWLCAVTILLVGVLALSLYKVCEYFVEEQKNRQVVGALIEQAVITTPPSPQYTPAPENGTPQGEEVETAPITVDFPVLQAQNPDIVAWLYCEDTPIHYPVLQSEDNSYYLRRLVDGSYNTAGSLFLDYRNAADFTGWSHIIYGHNMKNGSMFGTLQKYADQEYYEAHPVLYLLTPQQDYKIELIAGYTIAASSELYEAAGTLEAQGALIQEAREKSTFVSDVEVGPEDRVVVLSTCAYVFEDARYVLIGVMRSLASH